MTKAIPNLRLFLLLLFLSALVFGMDKSGILNLPKKYTYYLSNPISFGIYRTYQQIQKKFQFILSIQNAASQNMALKGQLAELLSENTNLRKQLSEAKAQIVQKEYLDPKTYKLIPARPIGLTRYLRLDRGTDAGIKIGQAVVFKDNLIGRIVEVSEKSAQVKLLWDPDSKISAFSLGLEGKAKGVAGGHFGTEIIMDKILHEEKIAPLDLVYSEGTEEYLPRGLILGKVKEVYDVPNEIFKQAKLTPVFDFRDLELVFVIEE